MEIIHTLTQTVDDDDDDAKTMTQYLNVFWHFALLAICNIGVLLIQLIQYVAHAFVFTSWHCQSTICSLLLYSPISSCYIRSFFQQPAKFVCHICLLLNDDDDSKSYKSITNRIGGTKFFGPN